MKTRKRPGIVTCDVSRAPLVPSGSLTTWTRISWPSFSRSSILACGWSRSPPRSRPRRSPLGSGRPRGTRRVAGARLFGRLRRDGRDRRLEGEHGAFRGCLGPFGRRVREADGGVRLLVLLVFVVVPREALELLDGVDDLSDV